MRQKSFAEFAQQNGNLGSCRNSCLHRCQDIFIARLVLSACAWILISAELVWLVQSWPQEL